MHRGDIMGGIEKIARKIVYPEKQGLLNDPSAHLIALGAVLHVLAPRLHLYGGDAATFFIMVSANISILLGGIALGIRSRLKK